MSLTFLISRVYQGLAMRLLSLVSATLFISSVGSAQTAPLVKPDPNGAANAGRTQLYQYLDGIAAEQTAARRKAIAAIHTRAEAEARQAKVRKQILRLLGGLPEKTPLNARVTGSNRLDGFRLEKVLFDSQPNFPVTALLYLPDSRPGTKLPAIVMAPGHGATGKASDFAMASTFARNGFAVLSYDPIGQGERLQYPDPARPGKSLATQSTGEHGEAGLQPALIGDAVARYFAWDGIRAVDYLLTRPEVDPARIGAFGCSGGGVMTAMLGALDPRVHAIASACYFTSYDTLLPALGPQDAEQSIPNFVAAGLDFPDWIELAAPRPYAIVSTVSDMFPWAGAVSTAVEARRFYSLFDPSAAGTPTGAPMPPAPSGPTLNPDTANSVPATAPLQFIAGVGGHGNVGPITGQIVSFFLVNLAHSTAAPLVPPPPARGAGPAVPTGWPKDALQVTPTGQVLTSYPASATVHSLNLKRAAVKLPEKPKVLGNAQLQTAIREVTHAVAAPGSFKTGLGHGADTMEIANTVRENLYFQSEAGIGFGVDLVSPKTPGRHPATLLVSDVLPWGDNPAPKENSVLESLAASGHVVLAFVPRPSPPGREETKSPVLGPFYMTELRAEITGKTLLGMRVDDVIRAVDSLAARPDVDPNNITAVASGHLGLVLLHAAVLDPRLKHITIDHTLESYASLLKAPLPLDAPQDILPGVLLHYDIPDLVRALGPRVTFTDPLPGTANLAVPAATAEHP